MKSHWVFFARQRFASILGAGVALALMCSLAAGTAPSGAVDGGNTERADSASKQLSSPSGLVYHKLEFPDEVGQMTYTQDGQVAYGVFGGSEQEREYHGLVRYDTLTGEITQDNGLGSEWVPANSAVVPSGTERLGVLVKRKNDQEYGFATVDTERGDVSIIPFTNPEAPARFEQAIESYGVSGDGARIFFTGVADPEKGEVLWVVDSKTGDDLGEVPILDQPTDQSDSAGSPLVQRQGNEVIISAYSSTQESTYFVRFDGGSLKRLGVASAPRVLTFPVFNADETALWGVSAASEGARVEATLWRNADGAVLQQIPRPTDDQFPEMPIPVSERLDLNRLFYVGADSKNNREIGSFSLSGDYEVHPIPFVSRSDWISPPSFNPMTSDLLFSGGYLDVEQGEEPAWVEYSPTVLLFPDAEDPVDQAGNAGDTVTFSAQSRGVTEAGGRDANFRWQVSGDGGSTWDDLVDDEDHTANFDSLTVTVNKTTQQNQYRGLISSGFWGLGELDEDGSVRAGQTAAAKIVPKAELAITTDSLPEGNVGDAYGPVTLTAMQVSGASGLTWSASGLPKGLVLDPATGVLSGIPTTAANVLVRVSAEDDTGIATRVLQLVVTETGKPPIVTPDPPVTTPPVTDPPITSGPTPSVPGGNGTGDGLAATGAGPSVGILWAGAGALLAGAVILIVRRGLHRRGSEASPEGLAG